MILSITRSGGIGPEFFIAAVGAVEVTKSRLDGSPELKLMAFGKEATKSLKGVGTVTLYTDDGKLLGCLDLSSAGE